MKKTLALFSLACLILLVGCRTVPPPTSTDSANSQPPAKVSLGETYFLFKEYDTSSSFDSICENMKQLGYSVEQIRQDYFDTTYPTEKMYRIVNKGNVDEGQLTFDEIIYVVVCDDTEIAISVFSNSMDYSVVNPVHRFGMKPFFQINSILRINNCVYFISNHEDSIVLDFFASANLPLPTKTSLFQGGYVDTAKNLNFETVLVCAKDLGYTIYTATDYTEEFHSCVAIVSPERDCYLYLVQMKDLDDQLAVISSYINTTEDWNYEALAEYYLNNFFAQGDNKRHQSVKATMISKNSFIVGTSYHVDRFIERMQKFN